MNAVRKRSATSCFESGVADESVVADAEALSDEELLLVWSSSQEVRQSAAPTEIRKRDRKRGCIHRGTKE